MTTGMRRGEVCALRWSRIDLELGVVDVRRSYRLRHGVGVEKDTKTHQMRRIALDSETVALLIEHKRRCAERMLTLGGELTESMYAFSNSRTFDPSTLARRIRCRAATATSPVASRSTHTSTRCATTRRRNC